MDGKDVEQAASQHPDWARELAASYVAGATHFFILHGNVHDFQFIPEPTQGEAEFPLLPDFLATRLFGQWDIVLHYDLTSPPRPLTGPSSKRLAKMREALARHLDPAAPLPSDPSTALALLDRLLERFLLLPENEEEPKKIALIFSGAEFLAPDQDIGQMAARTASQVETLLKWARNPYFRRVNVAFCLITERLADCSDRLVRNPHAATLRIPYPSEEDRAAFIRAVDPGRDAQRLARQTAGLTLVNLKALLSRARDDDEKTLKRFKKEMIERQCGGFVEFIEPTTPFDLVVGHESAKRRLRQDAELIKQGHFEAAPMGYLVCGPVGTGKSFLAECYAATVGLPCLKLLNFRSKYVGETEGNLERILSVLRVMGPVVIMVDEADAALGNREQEGDSGTSSRVFSQIAAQMGDSRYRGRIVWFLLTSRPDRLPVDIKRQGRAEVHIPLFYPETLDEMKAMFVAMARKNKTPLAGDAVESFTKNLGLSGADIESVVTQARREALTQNLPEVTRELLAATAANFIPSAQEGEKEYQALVAALECTDINFLPERYRAMMRDPEKRKALQTRLMEVRASLGMRV
ncbi:MAG: ATP-binding protein [Myxococcales bacterium]|nr:MAG: ATP-binding protein [Myxococcales bacterium]